MQKHLANLTILQPKTEGAAGSWHSALNHWKEARQLRKIESARADVVSQLTPLILEVQCADKCRVGVRGGPDYLLASVRREPQRLGSWLKSLRGLKPSEFPLAEPYRVKVMKATNKTNLSDYAQDMPEDKFKKETLELINSMYPNKEPAPGQLFKVVE